MEKNKKMSINDKIDIAMIILGCVMISHEYGAITGFALLFIAVALKREH